MAKNFALSVNFRPEKANPPGKSLFPNQSQPGPPNIRSIRAPRWRAARFLGRPRHGRSSRLAVEAAGSLWLDPFPALSRRLRPRACQRPRMQLGVRRRTYRSLRRLRQSPVCLLMASAPSVSLAFAAILRGSSRCPLPLGLGAFTRRVHPPTLQPVPLSRLRESAQHALNEVIETRGQARLEAAIAAQDDLAAALYVPVSAIWA